MEHYPVMLEKVLGFLAVRPDGTYVDACCGLAGHAGAIARRLTTGRVVALDRDAESLEKARENVADCAERMVFRQSRFSQLGATLEALGVGRVDGILADLGVNRWQLTAPERGLTFQQASALDMRLDRQQDLTAWDLVNRATESDLAGWISRLGEERRDARRISRAIITARPVGNTRQLADVVASAVRRKGKIHPATRVFQALRMVVNSEPEELEALLEQAPKWLKPQARWVMIAFQSLDDRPIKRAFQKLARDGRATLLTKHVVRPDPEEIRRNPPSRSAVLRAIEMK
jgi:16S rRNA (cytosine1402-N4)-methyltransferase